MSIEIWFAFALASATILAIPGPTVMLVISYALGKGRRTMWASVSGVTLGDFVAMTASLMGAGAVLATSATLFTALKLIGAAYLVWMGIVLWRDKGSIRNIPNSSYDQSKNSIFRTAFFVTALNPKSIIFFVAFVPQFISPNAPMMMQFIILETTFLVLAALNVIFWGYLAGAFHTRFSNPVFTRTINKIGGSFMILAGLITATIRKAT